MLHGIFYTYHSCLIIGVGRGLVTYSFSALVLVIIVSNSIPNLILVFLGKVDLTMSFWIFISIEFVLVGIKVRLQMRLYPLYF
jgi:hypothetical protein